MQTVLAARSVPTVAPQRPSPPPKYKNIIVEVDESYPSTVEPGLYQSVIDDYAGTPGHTEPLAGRREPKYQMTIRPERNVCTYVLRAMYRANFEYVATIVVTANPAYDPARPHLCHRANARVLYESYRK